MTWICNCVDTEEAATHVGLARIWSIATYGAAETSGIVESVVDIMIIYQLDNITDRAKVYLPHQSTKVHSMSLARYDQARES